MALWIPGAKSNPAAVQGGAYASGYAFKLVIHTTETDTFTPRSSSYYGHTGYPHLTIERDGTIWQHIDMDLAARALKNLSGGIETNRGGAWQIENCGHAGDGQDALSAAQIKSLQYVIKILHDQRGLDYKTLPPGAISGSARVSAPQRMSFSEWKTYTGICGHRHVPENDHWDPGGFDLNRLIPAEEPPPTRTPTGDDFMIRKGDGPSQYIRSYQFALNRFFTDTGGQPSMGWLVKDGVAGDQTFSATWEALQRLKSDAFSHTGAFDLTVNGIDSQATLEAAGIDPVTVAAIVGVAAIR